MDFDIYPITDSKAKLPEAEFIKHAAAGGARIVQYREKSKEKAAKKAEELREIAKADGVLFIVNDWVEVAKAADADGVHLGQDDADVTYARKILGKNKIIGRSTHSLEQALKAERDGADYISVGPIFKTPTKNYKPVGVELMKEVKNAVRIPVVAIGGVNESNIKEVIDAGATRIAMISALAKAENVADEVRKFRKIIRGE